MYNDIVFVVLVGYEDKGWYVFFFYCLIRNNFDYYMFLSLIIYLSKYMYCSGDFLLVL